MHPEDVKAQEIAREWVTLYLNGEHATLSRSIREHVNYATQARLCVLFRVMVAGIGETFGTAEDWSAHVLEALIEE